MSFDPSIFKNVSSLTLVTGCCDDCDGDESSEELTFTPELLYFAYILEGEESETQPFTITNTGTLPVGISSLTVSGDFEMTGTIPVSLTPGSSMTMQVKFKPTANGARIGEVIIDAGTAGVQNCVHLIGIGGEDTFTLSLADIQAQVDAVVAINATQASQILALQNLLDGYVSETPVYMWRAYANSPDGRTDFTTAAPSNHSFIGLAFNKLEETPSEDPDDYEWSVIGTTISNVISYDTEYVGGVPSTTIISNLTTISEQLLSYDYNYQALTDWLNTLLYVDGDPINAVIATLTNTMETADLALAEELHILGAATLDGESFILDLNKVLVSPELSLGIKLENMVTSTADALASIQTLQETIAGENFASASDLSLLGAKTLDGTAWIMDLDLIKVSPVLTFTQHLDTLVAAAFGDTASVTQLFEAVITPDGASAKAVLQLDVNGHVVGYAATNDGALGDVTFNFDSFNIIHPGTDTAIFSVSGGVVKMTNVEIDTLKVGSVTSDAVFPGAITAKEYFYVSYGAGVNGKTLGNTGTGTWAEIGLTGNKAKIITEDLPTDSQVTIRAYVNKKRTGGDSDRIWYRLKRTAPGGGVDYIGDTIQSGMAGYATVFSYEWIDEPPTDGIYSYTLEYYIAAGEGTFYSIKLVMDVGKR